MNAGNLYYPLSALVNGITSLVLGLIVFSRNRSNVKHITYGLFCLSIVVWSVFYFIWQVSTTKEAALFYSHALMAGATFIPIFYLHHILALLERPVREKRIIIPVYILGIIFLGFNLTPYYITGAVGAMSFKFWPKAGPLFSLFLPIWFAIVLYGLYIILKAYFASSGSERNKIRYVLIATIIGWGGGATNYPLWYGVNIPPFGNILVSAYIIITAYAIIRYRLMDVTVYMTRVIIILLIMFAASVLAFAATSAVKLFLTGILNDNWWYASTFISMLIAALACVGGIYVIKTVEEKKLLKLKEVQEALETSGRGMIEIDNVKRLAKIIPRYLTSFYYIKLGVKITHATIFLLDVPKNQYALAASSGQERQAKGKALLLNDPLCEWFIRKRPVILRRRIAKPRDIDVLRVDDIDYWMQNDKLLNLEKNMYSFLKDLKRELDNLRAVICVPSFYKENLLGFLLLGNKDEGMYNEEELELFSRLATNAAAAFRSAQLSEMIRRFEEEKAEAERLIATGELLNSIRHEMGNILNKISTGIEVMRDPYVEDKKEAFNKQGGKIIDNVIQAKTVWGYVDEYREKSGSDKTLSYNLKDVIDKALSSVNSLINKWRIGAFLTIDPRISIIGKETLPLIFKHLVINSCYGMERLGDIEEPDGQLSFSAEVIKEKNRVKIIQTDTGRDLTKDIENQRTMGGELFAEQGKLGGISLFLGRRIIKDHAGALDIESNDSKGTRFIITLPIDFRKVPTI
ncbi:MAG: hypothetical protein ISS34_05810 [Candidatus Omnitrophica bacterium]|nr:hypothetical protein [Candidatus Omnitrophota bacterium]